MIVGLMNTTETILDLLLVLLLKSHFMIGILERMGTPLPPSDFWVRSKPPKITISSFFTLMIDLNCDLEDAGGASLEVFSKKSEIFTFTSMVTWSSPETIGLKLMDKLASTGFHCLVLMVLVVKVPKVFWVST